MLYWRDHKGVPGHSCAVVLGDTSQVVHSSRPSAKAISLTLILCHQVTLYLVFTHSLSTPPQRTFSYAYLPSSTQQLCLLRSIHRLPHRGDRPPKGWPFTPLLRHLRRMMHLTLTQQRAGTTQSHPTTWIQNSNPNLATRK